MPERHSKIRKAAVLLASLDPATAERLLDQLEPGQASAARRALAELETVDIAEQQQVALEFARIGPLVPLRDPAGIELDSRLARQLASRGGDAPGPSDGPQNNESSWVGQGAPPLRASGNAQDWASYLARERPQTIALVVSHLAPEEAAQLLAALPAAVQTEVARRLVELDETDPDIVAELERGMASWLDEMGHLRRRRSAGRAALESILEVANAELSARLKNQLHPPAARRTGPISIPPLSLASHRKSPHVPPAAVHREEPKPDPRWRFADLERLDGSAFLVLLHHAPTEIVVLALAGASQELVERVLSQLPAHEANALRYAIDHLGPTRLSDVEKSQQSLADVARRLAAAGQLTAAKGGLSLAI